MFDLLNMLNRRRLDTLSANGQIGTTGLGFKDEAEGERGLSKPREAIYPS
jgi:hypothetical protein